MRFSEGKTISQRVAMAMLVAASLVGFSALTACGGSSSHGRYFAYIQNDVANVAPPAGGAVRHQAHAGAKHAGATHAALPTAASTDPTHTTFAAVKVTGIQPVPGDQDVYFYDTHTNTTFDVTEAPGSTGPLYVNSVQISHDDSKYVASVWTPVTAGTASPAYYQIWVGDKQLQAVTQITTDASDHDDVTFSADGSQITYDDGVGNIYTISAVGPTYTPAKVPISTLGIYAENPVFTPNGQSLVFDGVSDSVEYAIFSVPTAGGAVTQLSLPISNENTETFQYDYNPSVSPDGKQISFERETCPFDEDCTFDIWVMDAVTGETVNAATSLTDGTVPLATAGDSRQPQYLDDSNENIVYLSPFPNLGTSLVPGTGNDLIFEMNRDGTLTGLTTPYADGGLTTGPYEEYFKGEED